MRLLDLEASLLGTRREFDRALERLNTLFSMYREAGETHLAGRTLITKALYLYYKGDSIEACQTLEEGLDWIDKDCDPSLLVVSALNHLLLLEDCGRFQEARILAFKSRPQINQAGYILSLRLRWIEGRINYGLGRLESAEMAFPRLLRKVSRKKAWSSHVR